MENEEKIVAEIGEQQEEVVINDEPEVKEESEKQEETEKQKENKEEFDIKSNRKVRDKPYIKGETLKHTDLKRWNGEGRAKFDKVYSSGLPAGTEVKIFAVKDGWGQIYSQNSHGWINLEDIKITWIYK